MIERLLILFAHCVGLAFLLLNWKAAALILFAVVALAQAVDITTDVVRRLGK